jgi:uncharacterized protein (TIGR02594 family)
MASGGIHIEDYRTTDADPAQLKWAKDQIGTVEYIGRPRKPNPKVAGWIKEVSGQNLNPMTVPWCAYFTGMTLKSAGMAHTGSGMARSYLKWGTNVEFEDALPGDVVVTWRGKSDDGVTGHVFLFDGHSDIGCYGVGGNQGDSVSRQEFRRERIIGIRRYRKPSNSKTIRATGGAAGIETLRIAADNVIPQPPLLEAATKTVDELKDPIQALAQFKPWLLGILSVMTIGLALLALYYRYADHWNGKNQ